MINAAVLAPGYGGGPEQSILRALAKRLAAGGIAARGVDFRTRWRRPRPLA